VHVPLYTGRSPAYEECARGPDDATSALQRWVGLPPCGAQVVTVQHLHAVGILCTLSYLGKGWKLGTRDEIPVFVYQIIKKI